MMAEHFQVLSALGYSQSLRGLEDSAWNTVHRTLFSRIHKYHPSFITPQSITLSSKTRGLTFVSLGPSTVIHALWLVEWIISSQRLLQSLPCITAKRCSGRMPGLFFLWHARLSHQHGFRHYRNRTSEHLLLWQPTLNIPAIWVFIFIIYILIFKFIISIKNILTDL